MTFLVTGVGAIIGHGIIKALRMHAPAKIIGCNSENTEYGRYLSDKFYIVPATALAEWKKKIKEIYESNSVRLVFPGIHQDIDAFKGIPSIKAVLNTKKAITLGNDKWKMYEFAVENGIDVAYSEQAASADMKKFGQFVALKYRNSYAGKGQQILPTRQAFALLSAMSNTGNIVVQQHVGNDREEYTTSIYGYEKIISEPIIFKRRLNYGSTFYAETVKNRKLSDVVSRIAEKIGIRGPTNFQFRKEKGKYFLIDINPRFTSSTSIKAQFGFNEPAMAAEDYLNGAILKPSIKQGICERYIGDFYDI